MHKERGEMMRRWKIFCCLLLCLLLTGCDEDQEQKSSYVLYYVDEEHSIVESKEFEPEAEETLAMVEEVLQKADLRKEAAIVNYSLEGEVLRLDFAPTYRQMQPVDEMLNRAAIVKNFVQIPGISSVQFLVEGEDLLDTKGNAIGPMTGENFLEYSGKDITAYQYGTLKLYFADKNGKKLVEEERSLYYPSNSSIERVVVEQLIRGPKTENSQAVLSPSTKIVGVSVSDGIAYVNLGEKFLSEPITVEETLPIYAIVNSLVATGNVQKVQISVNGDTKCTFGQSMKLDQLYEQNLELVK